MAKELYRQRQNSYRRSSHRSSSVGPPTGTGNYPVDPATQIPVYNYTQSRHEPDPHSFEDPNDIYDHPPPPTSAPKFGGNMRSLGNDNKIPVELPSYESPPGWLPPEHRYGPESLYYDNSGAMFMPRQIRLGRKSKQQQFGFHVRGGSDLNCGVYVSVIVPKSLAEREGLRIKDHILKVNNIDFENMTHEKAVSVLRAADELNLVVRYFPAGYNNTLLYEKSPDTSRTWIRS